MNLHAQCTPEDCPRAYKEHFDKKRGEAEQLCDELNTKKTKQLSKQDKIRIQEQKKEAKSSLKELQKTWKTEVYEILKQTAVKKEWFWPDFKDAAAWRPRCPREVADHARFRAEQDAKREAELEAYEKANGH